jgi:hypothetical protein
VRADEEALARDVFSFDGLFNDDAEPRVDRLFLDSRHKPLKSLDWRKEKIWISLPSALIFFPCFL